MTVLDPITVEAQDLDTVLSLAMLTESRDDEEQVALVAVARQLDAAKGTHWVAAAERTREPE